MAKVPSTRREVRVPQSGQLPDMQSGQLPDMQSGRLPNIGTEASDASHRLDDAHSFGAQEGTPSVSATQPAAAKGNAVADRGAAGPSSSGSSIHLELDLNDPELRDAFAQFETIEERHEYAVKALRIGVAALKVASGRLDAETIQNESRHLLSQVSHQLEQHSRTVKDGVSTQLREYFDPESGRFNERVKRLVSRDGELEQVLRRQIGTQDSELAKTLLNHFGDKSPLMKRLSPTESDGLVQALGGVVEDQLRSQRERVLNEFSLDNDQGALSRLVTELTKNHGQLHKDLQAKIDDVVKEFSLDQENSALSRLVRNVDTAQKTIVREFSLDNPTSAFSRLNTILRDTQGAIHGNLTLDDEKAPLARLKRELLALLKDHSKENSEFREEVKATLAQLVAKREAAAAGTRHGLEFEDALAQFVATNCQGSGDIVSSTGNRVGKIKNCKVGDVVVELNRESQAAGAKIVIEAKEDAGYNLPKALEEMQRARKNRGAQIGIFVFSSKVAPEDLEPFARFGDDLVVVWNAEVPTSDVYLKAAIAAAKALCVRTGGSDEDEVDFDAIQRSILEIEKRSGVLDEVRKHAETIQSSNNKILDKVQRTHAMIDREVRTLHDKVAHWINQTNQN